MTGNLRHWDALKRTDPAHTKKFDRTGGFKGTATKPIYLIERLTEHFGPAGIGWGTTEPRFQVERFGEEVLVFCTIGIWYMDGNERSAPVYGTGGDNLRLKRSSGMLPNDEAFKAAQTDALSNAMKLLGVLADIHMGLHDDDKYVRELKREFADDQAAPTAPAQRPKPEPAPDDKEAALKALAKQIRDAIMTSPHKTGMDNLLKVRGDDLRSIKAASENLYLWVMEAVSQRDKDFAKAA